MAALLYSDDAIFRVGNLPSVAVDEGFVSRPLAYDSFGAFTAKSGPKYPDKAQTPLAALRLITDQVVDFFLRSAAYKLAEKEIDRKLTPSGFWSYVSATIGHGIVQHAHEQDAYVADKSSVSGLLGNDFLRNLHTLEGWKLAKQIWVGTRDQLTEFFNAVSRDIWTPAQYVALLHFAF